MESELFGDFLDYPGSFYYPDSFLIVQTVWNVLKVPLDFPDSFWIIQIVSGLSGQLLDGLESL